MQGLIDDLRAALDQMNRSLSVIADQNKQQTEILEQIAKKMGVKLTDSTRD